jgi:N-acetyl-alpha-D-muramate 1-phosphate uridylyltransferase
MSWIPDTAMVLAAGLGSRMRHLTDTVPKPLVALQGRPLIDHVLDRLADAGIPRAVVNVHYKADLLEAHLDTRQRPEIVIADERRHLLETGGGIKHALPLLGDQPFLVHNSDSVWIDGVGSNLNRLFAAWDDTRMDCLLMLALGASAVGYGGRGDFSLEADGRLRRRRDPEVVPFVYTGVQIVHPRLFADAPDGAFSVNALWNRALLQGRAFGVRMDGIWMHVGSPEELGEAEAVLSATAGQAAALDRQR